MGFAMLCIGAEDFAITRKVIGSHPKHPLRQPKFGRLGTECFNSNSFYGSTIKIPPTCAIAYKVELAIGRPFWLKY